MKIDLTCPVELWRYGLPTPEYEVCTLTMYNLSDKPVSSIQVTLASFDIQGEPLSRQVERIQGLEAAPGDSFEVGIPMEEGIQAADMELVIEKVWFDDATVWRRGSAHLAEYTPNTLPNNRKLEMLRFVAGADAIGFPQDQGAVWLCVCGRANAASESQCRRCHRQKVSTFENFNQTTIEEMVDAREKELNDIARRAREEASQKQLEREQWMLRQKRRRKRAFVGAILAVAAVGAAYGIYFHGIPYYRYVRATQQMSKGLYEEARSAFSAMGGYLDAADQVKRSDYLKALDDLKTGTEASLLRAQDAFDKLENYEDSAVRSKEVRYARAEKLMADKQYAQAAALYGEVVDYSDARMRQSDANFQQAVQLKNRGEFAAAREMFLALGDYTDAHKLADQCLYEPAMAAMDQKKYDEAIALFKQIPEYLGVDQQLQKASYLKAENLRETGQYEAAGELYLAAGNYLDSALKASMCIYDPAKKAMEQGDYSRAAEMFLKIKSYEDSQSLAWECIYQVAKAAMNNKEYGRAYQLLTDIPAYPGAQELAKECLYLPAKELLKKNDFAGALEAFAKIPDYKDVADQILEVKYKQASNLMSAKDYDAAIALYTELGSYSDSAKRMKDALYGQAAQVLTAGDYQAAIDRFSELDGYNDSEAKIQEAKYALAASHKEKGEFDQAVTLFTSLGKYKDAQDQVKDTKYAQANALLTAKQLEQAAQLFKDLKTYKDSQTLYQQCNYELAMQVKEAGELARAGRLFADISGYSDAKKQSEECFDAYYAQVLVTAREAMEKEDYKAVVDALSEVELSYLPQKYKELGDMYNTANYTYANDLYSAGKPYEALLYYRNIPDYKDVSTRRLKRNCYMVLGKWEGKNGNAMEFREDGTCTIDGEELFFNVNNYAMNTGVSATSLTLTHKVSAVTEKSLSLRDMRDGRNVVYKLTRVAE